MKRLSIALICVATSLVAGCSSSPRERDAQWVARDAWDSTCAEQATVETWSAQNGRWKIQGEVWLVDVDAKFKLVNACTSGLPLIGKAYKQFETVDFKATVEMSRCVRGGEKGWALPGKEGSRCWTGPTLVAGKAE